MLCVVCLLGAADLARADVNPKPIAVPLIGTSGIGSPYPSTINVIARGGPSQLAAPRVILHKVTHPCIEQLAVLLVHNDTDKFLLLSQAGGCKPLQGTDLIFDPNAATSVPDTPLDVMPYGPFHATRASSYGIQPTFPAPAPPPPYQTTMPSSTLAQGKWDLYVMDVSNGLADRGVIAAGWSLNYGTRATFIGTSVPVPLPATGSPNDRGQAGVYPILFDLSQVPAGVKVRDLELALSLTHTHPDDIRLLLESPNGNRVQVMSDAGGGNNLVGTTIFITDNAVNSLPDSTQIFDVASYKPTSYGADFAFPAPAPGLPYGALLADLYGQDARGIWKLWAWDDANGDKGSIDVAHLRVGTERAPDVNFEVPTSGATYTANTPFLHIEASVSTLPHSPHSATWRVTNGGEYYASGPMTMTPDSNHVTADVPLKKGSNVVEVTVRNTSGLIPFATDTIDVTVNEFVYTLSEGATGGFFDLDVTMANPTNSIAPVKVDFLPEHSAPVVHNTDVAFNGQVQLHVDDLAPADAISTIVHSTNAVPLAVERTMSWDATGYGGSGGTALTPNKHWLFAEGSQGFFDTFILLANDNATQAVIGLKYLIEGGTPLTVIDVVPPHSRKTIYAGDQPEVVNTSFGLDITSNVPITAERSMYFPHSGGRTFEGGHETAGTNGTSTKWYLAEGATGPFFETFVLLSNPNGSTAHASLTYLLPDGTTIPQSVDIPADGRVTIDVETVAPALANTPVSTIITSNVGIIVERSMYWPDISAGWSEAHNSVGVTEPALRWAVADGRIGGPRDHQTYVLLANPNPVPAEVIVRFFQFGAAPVSRTYTLPPTSRTNIAPGSDIPELSAGVFSADVNVLNYQPIIVEKALYWNSGGQVWAAGTGTVGTPIPPPE